MFFVSFVQPCRCRLWKSSVLFALCFMLSVLNLVFVCSVIPKYFRVAVFRSCWEWIEYGNFMDVCKWVKYNIFHLSGLKSIDDMVFHCSRKAKSGRSSQSIDRAIDEAVVSK